MAARDAIAIELGRRRIRAVLAASDGGALRVRRVLVEDVPASLDFGDPSGVGAWLKERLAEARFPRGRATIALARDDVGLKRLVLPSADDDELPGMTKLAIQREIPFDADQAVIDFVPVERTVTHTTVVAVAAPERVLDWTRAVVRAAGLEVDRIGLRAMGSAALLNHLQKPAGAADCFLAVDVTSSGVEFCVLENGAIRFSRAAALDERASFAGRSPGSDNDENRPGTPRDETGITAAAAAEAIVTEARRTWMSYRIVEGASDVTRVALMGDARVTGQAAGPIGAMLGAEASVLDTHPLIDADGAVMDRVWPLAGLLLESALDLETIDFASPHRPADRAGAWRRRVGLATGVLVILLLALWTVGNRSLGALDRELTRVRNQAAELRGPVERYQRDTFALAHLKGWERAGVSWLDHLLALQAIAPDPGATVLDSWSGTLGFDGVRYDREAGRWSSPLEITIVLDGEARDRRTADALRDALVRSDWYHAQSSGADTEGGRRLPHGFTYRVETSHGSPPTGEADGKEASP